jgi:hypothetical protein
VTSSHSLDDSSLPPGYQTLTTYLHPQEIDDVRDYLSQPELPPGAIAEISRDTGIPRQTLTDWHQKRIEEGGKDWFRLAQGYPKPELSAPKAKLESPTLFAPTMLTLAKERHEGCSGRFA